MRMVLESQVQHSTQTLDEAWSEAETFLFMPERDTAQIDWALSRLELLPEPYLRDHFVLPTSGTTQHPRLIVASRARAESLVGVLHRLQESEGVSETIVTLPLSYCYAFINQWLWARVHERQLVLTAGFGRPESVLRALHNATAAMLCLVGPQVPLLKRYFADQAFPKVVRVHFAGSPFPQDELEVIHSLFPNAVVFNNYGCTEAMPRLSLRRADDSEDPANVGSPLPGIDIRTDSDGFLQFRSPYRLVGVIDENKISFPADDDWIPSGDLGGKNEYGELMLLGRATEVIKRYGEKISLPQILFDVREIWDGEAAFYVTDDGAVGQGHVLVLSPTPSPQSLRRVLQLFRGEFGRPHWPIRIESIGEMPRTSNGKVDVGHLPGIESTVVWRQRGHSGKP